MKKTYRIRVREVYTAFVDVEATNGVDAIEEIERQIDNGEYVVSTDLSADLQRKCSVVRIVGEEPIIKEG